MGTPDTTRRNTKPRLDADTELVTIAAIYDAMVTIESSLSTLAEEDSDMDAIRRVASWVKARWGVDLDPLFAEYVP